MTNPEPIDYAALIRAVTPNSERKHPEWLDSGEQLFSPKYGQGKVISWVGNKLIEPIWDLFPDQVIIMLWDSERGG